MGMLKELQNDEISGVNQSATMQMQQFQPGVDVFLKHVVVWRFIDTVHEDSMECAYRWYTASAGQALMWV